MATDACTAARRRRARRAAAARWLAGLPQRPVLDWGALIDIPAWVWAEADQRDAWALHIGAWQHADSLRRCIDGATLATLRAALGSEVLTAITADPPANDAPVLPVDATGFLRAAGRTVLLAGIGCPGLRATVRQVLWPSEAEVGDWAVGLNPIEALALMRRVGVQPDCKEACGSSARPASEDAAGPAHAYPPSRVDAETTFKRELAAP